MRSNDILFSLFVKELLSRFLFPVSFLCDKAHVCLSISFHIILFYLVMYCSVSELSIFPHCVVFLLKTNYELCVFFIIFLYLHRMFSSTRRLFLFHVFVSYSQSCLKIQNTKIRHICWGLSGEQWRFERYKQEL